MFSTLLSSVKERVCVTLTLCLRLHKGECKCVCVCVIPICQSDSWFSTFHLLTIAMLRQEQVARVEEKDFHWYSVCTTSYESELCVCVCVLWPSEPPRACYSPVWSTLLGLAAQATVGVVDPLMPAS